MHRIAVKNTTTL